MEDKLRIRVEQNGTVLEIEGPTQTVLKKFDELKKDGLGKLFTNTESKDVSPNVEIVEKTRTKKDPKKIPKKESNFPSLRDVVLKDLPKTEKEWILIYGFYAGEYGSKEFQRESILKLYDETKRRTDSRTANVSNNIKSLIKSELFRFINDHDILLTEKGKTEAANILQR